jgi:hypothetical protein
MDSPIAAPSSRNQRWGSELLFSVKVGPSRRALRRQVLTHVYGSARLHQYNVGLFIQDVGQMVMGKPSPDAPGDGLPHLDMLCAMCCIHVPACIGKNMKSTDGPRGQGNPRKHAHDDKTPGKGCK